MLNSLEEISCFAHTTTIAYHIFQQVRSTKLCKKIPKLNLNLKFYFNQAVNIPLNPVNNPMEVCEPLLDEQPQPNMVLSDPPFLPVCCYTVILEANDNILCVVSAIV